MKNRLSGIAVGGLSFWLPSILVGVVLYQNVQSVSLNVVVYADRAETPIWVQGLPIDS
jgi:hypothetical protein